MATSQPRSLAELAAYCRRRHAQALSRGQRGAWVWRRLADDARRIQHRRDHAGESRQ